MSPREKKTASKNTGPAVTRTSSKGSLSPTKVTVPRIKRALADIGVRASDRPDGSLLTLTDKLRRLLELRGRDRRRREIGRAHV